MDLSPEKLQQIAIYLFVLIASIAFHEFGHAIVAHKLGDDTPSRQGRVTLNPVAHIDPIGTLLLPIVGALYGGGGFGWGKPVQWNPARIRRGIKMSTAQILVSVAGPFMNLVLAFLTAIASVVLVKYGVITYSGIAFRVLTFATMTNFVLMFFNLIPVPPLDGGHVVEQFVPYKHRQRFENIYRYAPFLLLGIMLIPQIQQVFLWPAVWCTSHLFSLLGLPS